MSAVDVLARTLPSLAMIVGALLVLRYVARRGRPGGTGADVRVVTRAGIAKGAVVAVVDVSGRRLLVGASEHGVNLLTELDHDTELAPADPAPASTPAAPPAAAPTASTDRTAVPDLPRDLLRRTIPSLTSADRPRMAPIDRLRHLTVRTAVPSHPRRPSGVRPPRP